MAPNLDHVLRLHSAGLNVLIIDYRGYGESTGGPPRERSVYEDAERAWTHLVTELHFPPANIVRCGHSLAASLQVRCRGGAVGRARPDVHCLPNQTIR